MNLSQNLVGKAEEVLRFEGHSGLPKQIGETPFYVAQVEDESILGHGVAIHEEKEYKIGTKRKQ